MKPTSPASPVETSDFNRRDFLKGSSTATLVALMGGTPLIAPRAKAEEAKPVANQSGAPMKVAVIGCGVWGRDILNTLARLNTAEVVAVCDTYPAMLKRAKEAAPKAETVADYKKVLENKDVAAVIVATPSHQHKEIVIAALQAGKQVYCEAPLAHTIQDAKEIAQAAKAAPFQYFQAGLSLRADGQRKFINDFIRAGAAGKVFKARLQWHRKQSWRRTSPNVDREKELNWRLDSALSPGLIGEVSIHQIDNLAWFLGKRPRAVTGFSTMARWGEDGRDVPDTALAVYEFPGGTHVTCEATLANSFDADYEIVFGTDSAVMLRGEKAWMFKEVDAPMLGWEVYARKEVFYRENGIVLVANATKKTEKDPNEIDSPFVGTPLYNALDTFLYNADVISTAIKDFVDNFGPDDKQAMGEALAQAIVNNKPAASWKDGYEATVMSLIGHEATVKKTRIEIPASAWEV